MFKLYLKKLLWCIIFLMIFVFIYFLSFNLLYTVSNFFKDKNILQQIILFGIPFICSLIFLCYLRINNKKFKTEYLSTDEHSFLKDIYFILKSKNFICEILAFNTFLIPLFVFIGISENFPLIPFIVGTILLILLSNLPFVIVDLLIWFLICKKWLYKKGFEF